MLESIFKTCIPRDEVLGGNLSEDVFAAKLKQVVDGNAPLVYQDPNTFLQIHSRQMDLRPLYPKCLDV